MSLVYDEETQHVIDVWMERFGEPPAIMADLDLMWSVLNASTEDRRPPDRREAAVAARLFDEEAHKGRANVTFQQPGGVARRIPV
jgi:hypothetical protein